MAPHKPKTPEYVELSAGKLQRDPEPGSSVMETVAQALKQKKAPYEDYLRLLQDEDLRALMVIPFSAELAELTRQAGQGAAAPAEPASRRAAQRVKAPTTLTLDETIIREAIARELDKSPSGLVESDYARVTKLDLSLSKASVINKGSKSNRELV